MKYILSGKLVRKRREELNLTLPFLANLAQMHDPNLWRIEKGIATNCTVNTLCHLAKVLRVNLIDLIEEEP